MIDGWSGIQIKNSNNITVKNLEIAGPALDITGEEASNNRLRLAGRDSEGNLTACGLKSESNCSGECKWSSTAHSCLGKIWSYYAGKGIEIKESSNVSIRANEVHHCTDSGIRCDKCDDVTIA